MAVIPQYERQVKERRTIGTPKQSLNAPIEAFGGGVARGLAGLSKGLDQVADVMAQQQLKIKKEREAAWTSQAMAQLATRYEDYTFGENGVYKKTGESATGSTGQSREDLQQMIDEISKEAPGQDAASAFQQRALSLKTSTSHSIARHESDQLKNWAVNSRAENVQAQVKRIGAHWSWEPERIEKEFDVQASADLAEIAKVKGVPVESLIRAQKEKLYAGVIKQNLAAGATEKSKALLERWTDAISSETRVQLTASIRKKEIDATAEDAAFNYYNQLQTGETTQTTANDEIRQIKDPDLRRATRRMFDAYARQFKADQAAMISQESIARLDELDNMYGDLVAQQKYVDDFDGNSKVKTKLEARLKRYKSAEGLKPMTDPGAYADATEKIVSGGITSPEQIDLLADVEKQDKDDLKRSLGAAQKSSKRALKVAYTQSRGIEGGAEATLKKGKKKDFGEFLMWAEKMAQETNRAQEPDYFQKLADMWVLEGELTGEPWWKNEEVTFGERVRSGEDYGWVHPEADTNFRSESPEVQKVWTEKYGNDMEKILSIYSEMMVKQGIGPKGR